MHDSLPENSCVESPDFPRAREHSPLRWLGRAAAGAVLALVVGSMPVYIHREMAELARLKAELEDARALAESMYGRMEDSAARLHALKTARGAARVMREKGYVPPNARVYQVEPEKLEKPEKQDLQATKGASP